MLLLSAAMLSDSYDAAQLQLYTRSPTGRISKDHYHFWTRYVSANRLILETRYSALVSTDNWPIIDNACGMVANTTKLKLEKALQEFCMAGFG